jgi:diaminopimelate decarboxylase
MQLRRFASVADVVTQLKPAVPVLCPCPDAFGASARRFVAGFPGAVHYAVKANPHPQVLRWLSQGGVSGFDVASITEIALVRRELGPGAILHSTTRSSRVPISKPRMASSVSAISLSITRMNWRN